MAEIYQPQRRIAQAEQTIGEDHPDTLDTRERLQAVLLALGRTE